MAKIPLTTIKRLSLYYRVLRAELRREIKTISSRELADRTTVPSNQIRRDLAYFGQFGRRGAGYEAEQLTAEIEKILGLDRPKNVAIVGAGNLGKAFASYKGFARQGFHLVAIFDNNSSKVGRKISGVDSYFWGRLELVIKEKKIELALVAVPAHAAQEVAEKLVQAGVRGILNFAPVNLAVPSGIKVVNVDLTQELEVLSYFLKEGNL